MVLAIKSHWKFALTSGEEEKNFFGLPFTLLSENDLRLRCFTRNEEDVLWCWL